MKTINLRRLALVSCVTILNGAYACAHEPEAPAPTDRLSHKAQKSPSSVPPAATKGQASSGPERTPGLGPDAFLRSGGLPGETGPLALDSQLSFFRRVSRPQGAFGESDRRYLDALPKTFESGSLAEAALVVGVVRSVLTPPLSSREPGASVTGSSLDKLCLAYHIDLPKALAESPFLQRADIAAQVIKALNAAPVSEDFKVAVTASLQKIAADWGQVSREIPPSGATTASAQAGPLVGLPPLADPTGGSGSANTGEAILSDAQGLADRGDFKAAIKRLQDIPISHPLKSKAFDKIKEFSNQGVQDLRRKAALAFQSALPVSDPKTKGGYLRQAKSFLEDALKSFPEATQLPTVQDNLRVISLDLEKIEHEGRR